MRTTDMADELFRGPETELPAGVRLATVKRGGVTVTRVEIAREGLARPRGRYVTLEMPSVSVLDERDTDVIETGAAELRALRQLAAAMVDAVRPAALICVDSLCSAEAARLGRTIQFSDTGLHPADARHARHLDAAALGVPVIAAGIPTLMDADEGADLVLTPRALDSVIAHGSALLAGILNRALQPRLSVAQLCWLTG